MSTERGQQIYEEMRILESQYNSLTQHESMLGSAYREAESAAASMRVVKQSSKTESLVPVGSGVFFSANMSDPGNVILNIGAGVAIKKDIAYATNYIEMRIKELNVALGNAAGRKQEIAARIQQGKEEFERLAHTEMGSAREPAQGNV